MPTMASADSCPITQYVAMTCAVVKYRPHVEQVSPDKNVNCPDATAAFTLSPESWVLSCGADLPGNWALYAVSVPFDRLRTGLAHRFTLRLPSDGLSRFRPCLRGAIGGAIGVRSLILTFLVFSFFIFPMPSSPFPDDCTRLLHTAKALSPLSGRSPRIRM